MTESSNVLLGQSEPVVSVYPLGLTAGCPPSISNHQREERSNVSGWSQRSARGNTKFLYSVNPEELTGIGYALTFTLKTCPQTHDEWKLIRERLFQSFRRRGTIRLHWVTEWQRRGVPHLHAAVWFKEQCEDIIFLWLLAAAEYQPAMHCQTAAPIHDAPGWFKYLAKHAARGVSHYQRSSSNIPFGWLKTGRMWGKTGHWPTQEPAKHPISWTEYWMLRRLARNWRQKQARNRLEQKRQKIFDDIARQLGGGSCPFDLTTLDLRRFMKCEINGVRAARKMLQCHDPKLSPVRGISDWIPTEVTVQMMTWCHHCANDALKPE